MFLGAKLIIAEYAIGVLLSVALGVWTLLRMCSRWQPVMGVYLILLGINYVPTPVYAVTISNRGSALTEIGDELTDQRRAMAKYQRQSVFLLLPLVVVVTALRQGRMDRYPAEVAHTCSGRIIAIFEQSVAPEHPRVARPPNGAKSAVRKDETSEESVARAGVLHTSSGHPRSYTEKMVMKRSLLFWLVAAMSILGACASNHPLQVKQDGSAAGSGRVDASALLPKENVVAVKVVKKELLGKSFMPGGALASYQKGKKAYQMFLSELPTPTDSAIVLAHWDEALKSPKVVRSLDAYYGVDTGRPIYVFARGRWIAGITGLSEQEADRQARMLAAHL